MKLSHCRPTVVLHLYKAWPCETAISPNWLYKTSLQVTQAHSDFQTKAISNSVYQPCKHLQLEPTNKEPIQAVSWKLT